MGLRGNPLEGVHVASWRILWGECMVQGVTRLSPRSSKGWADAPSPLYHLHLGFASDEVRVSRTYHSVRCDGWDDLAQSVQINNYVKHIVTLHEGKLIIVFGTRPDKARQGPTRPDKAMNLHE